MALLNDTASVIGQARAQFANLLKDYYADLWDNHVHEEGGAVARKLATKGGRMGGKKVVAAVTDNLPQSAGISMFERGALPRPSAGTYFNPELISRGLFTRLRWTAEVELAAKAGDKAAWARPRQKDMQDAELQFDINFGRKLWLGYADILGVVASHAVSGTSVITLQPRNGRDSQGESYWYSGRFYLRVGMQVTFIDVSVPSTALGAPQAAIEDTTSNWYNVTITAVGGTDAAPTVTLSADVTAAPTSFTPAAGDFMIGFANRRSTINATPADAISQFSSINGVQNLASDATHYAASYGLAKSSYPTLNGLFLTNPAGAGTQRTFRERLVMFLYDQLSDLGTGQVPDCLFLNKATRREVVLEHDGDRQYAPVVTESGFGQLVANVGDTRTKYMEDWQCPPGVVHGLHTGNWKWLSLADLQPLGLERFVADYAQNEIIFHKHGNLQCEAPYNNGSLEDISYSMTDVA